MRSSPAPTTAIISASATTRDRRRPVSEPRALTLQVPAAILEAIAELVETRVLERLAELDIAHERRQPDYLTVPEAAERLRASRQRVYDLLSSGRLRRFKDGARVLIASAELDAYLAGGAMGQSLPISSRSRRGSRARVRRIDQVRPSLDLGVTS